MTVVRRSASMPIAPRARRVLRVIAIVIAGLGVAIGIQGFLMHARTDPFVDLRVYYDAGARLNAGLPLYDDAASQSTGLYLYPPLLAILFRPLALLPFEVVAPLWFAIATGAVVLTILRAGIREPVLIALGCLAMPVAWSLAVGQVEPVLTLLFALGSPVAIGLATNVKVFPVLVAVYWVSRRDLRSLGQLAATIAALVLFQLVVEPAATRAWFELTWLRPAFEVRNISPFAIHPGLWLALVVILGLVALRLGPTRHGWAAAMCFAVLVYPRLLAYQLMSLLAGFAGPRQRGGG